MALEELGLDCELRQLVAELSRAPYCCILPNASSGCCPRSAHERVAVLSWLFLRVAGLGPAFR